SDTGWSRRTFVSTSDKRWPKGVGEYIRDLFPERCQYERRGLMSRYPNPKTGLANTETSRGALDQAALVPANEAILEIGVFRARTTCWLAHGAKSGKGAHVWGVDPWDLPTASQPKGKFRDPKQRRLAQQHVHEAGVRSQVTLVQAFSVDFARGWTGPRIGLIYID